MHAFFPFWTSNMCGFYTTPGNSRILYIKGNFFRSFPIPKVGHLRSLEGQKNLTAVGLPGSFAQTQRSSKGSMPEAKWRKFEGKHIQQKHSRFSSCLITLVDEWIDICIYTVYICIYTYIYIFIYKCMYIYIDVFLTQCCWPKVWYVTPSCGVVGGWWVVVGDVTFYFNGLLPGISLWIFELYKNFPHVPRPLGFYKRSGVSSWLFWWCQWGFCWTNFERNWGDVYKISKLKWRGWVKNAIFACGVFCSLPFMSRVYDFIMFQIGNLTSVQFPGNLVILKAPTSHVSPQHQELATNFRLKQLLNTSVEGLDLLGTSFYKWCFLEKNEMSPSWNRDHFQWYTDMYIYIFIHTYIHIYTYIHICIIYICTYIHIYKYTHIYRYTYIYIHIYIYTYIQIYIYTYIQIYICTYIPMFTYIHIHIYIYLNLHIFANIYIYLHTYIYIYLHTYIYIYISIYTYTHIYLHIHTYRYRHI